MTKSLTRRTFLKTATAAGGGLMIGAYLPLGNARTALAAGTFEPNVWIKVNADDTVRIMLTMLEMGQGVMTSMPMLVAEELDFDWTKIKTEWAGADAEVRQPELRRPAAHRRQQQRARHVEGAARVRRGRALDARHRRRADLERSREHADDGQGRGHSSGERPSREVRHAGGQGGHAAGAEDGHAEGSEGLQGPRPVAAATRRAGEGQRHGAVRHRREAARPAHRARREMPGVRRQGRQLQRRQGQGDQGRHQRRPDQRRHRRRRRELLGGVAGRAGAAGHVGRRSAREPEQRGDQQEAGGARAAAGQGRAQRRQRRGGARSAPRRSDRTAGAHVRARVRSAVPRARVHGADELHGRREGRQLRRLRADAGADRLAAGGDGRVEAAGGQGAGSTPPTWAADSAGAAKPTS